MSLGRLCSGIELLLTCTRKAYIVEQSSHYRIFYMTDQSAEFGCKLLDSYGDLSQNRINLLGFILCQDPF